MDLLIKEPLLFLTTLLTLGVIFVNGWTDAPNAIATCVCTGAISLRRASLMAAVCNLAGAAVLTRLNASVAATVCRTADFGGDAHASLVALSAALLAVILWATAAWRWGIPTSESHGLLAGLAGAAVALRGLSALRGEAWGKILAGLGLSLVLGFLAGVAVAGGVARLCRRWKEARCRRFFQRGQVAGAAATAFMHGAQDGQKFTAILFLAAAFARGDTDTQRFTVSMPVLLLSAALMALGTAVGGDRILRRVGEEMVPLRPDQGFSADVAATLTLGLFSLTGIPVSTTHAKTAAILGAGSGGDLGRVSLKTLREMVLAWVFTFPGCGLLGYLSARFFLAIAPG